MARDERDLTQPKLRLVQPDEKGPPILRRGPYTVIPVPATETAIGFWMIQPSWGKSFGWHFTADSAQEYCDRLNASGK